MTARQDEQSHPAPARDKAGGYQTFLAVCAAPIAWIVQLSASFALSTTPCFAFGERAETHPGTYPWALVISIACLVIAAAGLWMALILRRRTQGETGGGHRHLLETGQGRTRFLATWGIAFDGVFVFLIAVNIVLLLAFPVCAS